MRSRENIIFIIHIFPYDFGFLPFYHRYGSMNHKRVEINAHYAHAYTNPYSLTYCNIERSCIEIEDNTDEHNKYCEKLRNAYFAFNNRLLNNNFSLPIIV